MKMKCELCKQEFEGTNKICKYCSKDLINDYNNNPLKYKNLMIKYELLIENEEI